MVKGQDRIDPLAVSWTSPLPSPQRGPLGLTWRELGRGVPDPWRVDLSLGAWLADHVVGYQVAVEDVPCGGDEATAVADTCRWSVVSGPWSQWAPQTPPDLLPAPFPACLPLCVSVCTLRCRSQLALVVKADRQMRHTKGRSPGTQGPVRGRDMGCVWRALQASQDPGQGPALS